MPVRVTRRRPSPSTAGVTEVAEVIEVPTEGRAFAVVVRCSHRTGQNGRRVGGIKKTPHRRFIPPPAYAQMWFSTIKSGSKLAMPHSATPYLQGAERSIRGHDITHITAW